MRIGWSKKGFDITSGPRRESFYPTALRAPRLCPALAPCGTLAASGDVVGCGRCADPACTAGTLRSVDTTASSGGRSVVLIGSGGQPFVFYLKPGDRWVWAARCSTPDCASLRKVNAFEEVSTPNDISGLIGTDGLPLAVWWRTGSAYTSVGHCGNRWCLPGFRPR